MQKIYFYLVNPCTQQDKVPVLYCCTFLEKHIIKMQEIDVEKLYFASQRKESYAYRVVDTRDILAV